jgi:hypothetical protein
VETRRTTRCKAALTARGFALGGKAAAALRAHRSLPRTRRTLRRILRPTPAPAEQTPRMRGADDVALRRGKKDGTILINGEDGTPGELFPDRQATTRETWRKDHPGVQTSQFRLEPRSACLAVPPVIM